MVFSLFLGTAYMLLYYNGIATASLQLVAYPNIRPELLKMCTNSKSGGGAKSSDYTLLFKFQYNTQRSNPVSTATLHN